MDKMKNSMASRLLALLLACTLLLGMIPAAVASETEAETEVSAPALEALVNGGTVEGNVVTFSGITLNWDAADPAIGRNADGWWIGMKVTAPAELNMEKAAYQRKSSSGWGEEKLFQQYKDSADDAETQYITMWGLVNEAYLNNAVLGDQAYLSYTYRFDWDGDGTYEQEVSMRVDVNNITLNKDGSQVYPMAEGLADVQIITDGVSVTDNGSNIVKVETISDVVLAWAAKDESIGRYSDGWWIGYEVVAPEGWNPELASYQYKTSTGWDTANTRYVSDYKDTENSIYVWRLVNETYLSNALANGKNVTYTTRYDWDGDGVYEQIITLEIDPAKVVLKNENGQQVYPCFGTVTPLTGGTVSGDQTALELVIEETTLNWSAKDETIGRNVDGWWVGMLVTAPDGYTEEQLKNATYKKRATSNGGAEWTEYSESGSFWGAKDSQEGAASHYVGVWMVLTPALLADYEANGNYIQGEYVFDWDGNGVDDQTILVTVIPSERIVLNKESQTGFGFAEETPADQWVGAPYTNVASGGQGTGAVTYAITEGADVAEINAETGELTFKTVGTVVVTATKAADDTYLETTASYTVKAVKNIQDTFKFENSNERISVGFSTGSFVNVASGGLGSGDVTYTLVSGEDVVTLNETTGEVQFRKAGEAVIKATKAEDALYEEATATYTLIVEKSAQAAIAFAGTVPATIVYQPDAQNILTAEGGSGNGDFRFSIISGNEYAKIDEETGAITTLKAGGSFTVQLDKAGDGGYLDAVPVTATIYVEYAAQTGFDFLVQEPENITFNDNNNLFINQAQGGESKGEITYAFADQESAEIAEINATTGQLTIKAAGTIRVVATKAGDDCYQKIEATYSLTVDKDVPEFTVSDVELVYGVQEYQIVVDTVLGGSGGYLYAIEGENTIGAAVDSNGKVTFSDSEGKVGTVTIKVTKETDNQYLEAEKTFQLTVAYHETEARPTVTGATRNASGWYTGVVTITAPADYQISYANALSNDTWADAVTVSLDGRNETYIYLKTGNEITDAIALGTILVDTAAPSNIRVTYDTPFAEKLLETLSFGIYQAKSATVTLHATDMTSGVDYFTYSIGEGDIVVDQSQFTKNENGTAEYSFTVSAQFRNKVTVKATDVAGWTSELGESDKVLVLDSIDPVLSVTYGFAGSQNMGDIIYSNDQVTAYFAITEANFDLRLQDPAFTVNQTAVALEWTYDEENGLWKAEYTLSEEGDYVIGLTFTDASGNEMTAYTQQIHLDYTAPVFSVTYDNNEAENEKYYKADRVATIQITEHNFKPEEVELKVTAWNIQGNVDISAKGYAEYARDPANWTQNGDVWTLNTEGMKFDVDASYRVELRYTDLAENEAEAYEAEFVIDHAAPEQLTITYSTSVVDRIINAITFGFYQPEVIVTVTANDVTSGVDFFEWSYTREDGASEKNEAALSGKLETGDIAYSNDGYTATATFTIPAQARGYITAWATDRAGNTSEETDENETVIVVDTIAPGISMTYEATAEDAECRYVAIDENGKLVDVEKVEDADAIYFNGNTIATVIINEANFFEGVAVTDREGAVIEYIHGVHIKLTKTDNNGVVTVYEYLLEGTEQLYADAEPVYISWTDDGDKHSFTISYDEDADYVVEITYTDLSDNRSEYTSQMVTVDKIAPEMEVTYDNNDARNENFYNADRVATIRIEEHNFRADDVALTVIAKDINGNDVTLAVIGQDPDTGEEITIAKAYTEYARNPANWLYRNAEGEYVTDAAEAENADVRYLVLPVFEVEAIYRVELNYWDLAKNAVSYTADFVVDKTAAVDVTIAYSVSVLDQIINAITFGYYQPEVIVTVTANDITAGVEYFKITYHKQDGASGVNTGSYTTGELVPVQSGNIFTYEYRIPANARGTVSVVVVDKAGNESGGRNNEMLVVDNIAPEVEIAYNEPVRVKDDISYYAGNIDATITITEANFYSEDVVVLVNGEAVEVDWTDRSVDEHIGTFTLTEDGDYVITVEYTDRSENEMISYTSNQLTLDTTAPSIQVSNIVMDSANKDDVYGFVLTAHDINIDASYIVASLRAVLSDENGNYRVEYISLGQIQTEDGQTYTYTVENLELDGLYSLTCEVRDLADNLYSMILLEDGKEYEEVSFSINRNGSTFGVDAATQTVLDNYYVYSVDQDLVIVEVNVDPIEEYTVKLNGVALEDGYTTTQTSEHDQWSKRTYVISKELFAEEGEYSIVIESTDKAGSNAYSDVKELKVSFVVDQTAPVLTISGVANNGRYQVEEQTVTILPTDDGGRLNSLRVVVLDSDGNPLKDDNGQDISVRFDMSGEEFLTYLAENGGKVTFTIPEGLEHQVQIVCDDCAVNAEGQPNVYQVTFQKVTVSQSIWIIFYANKPLFYGSIAGVILLIAAIIFLLKKRKKAEKK